MSDAYNVPIQIRQGGSVLNIGAGGTLQYSGTTQSRFVQGTTTLTGGSAVVATGLSSVTSLSALPLLAGTATLGAAGAFLHGTIQASGTITLFAYLTSGTQATSATVTAAYVAFGS
jgi:hypothetical protein